MYRATAVFTLLAGSAVTALAEHAPAVTSVGPIPATIMQLNYGENGAVNGFVVGTNVLLTFLKPVCGGIGTLGTVGNNVTYSGTALTSTSGFETVIVSSFTNGSITYPTATPPKPTAYPATTGTIKQLNYDAENGSIDGFVFTPTSGPQVFVDLEHVSATLAPKLTVGTSLSVTGTLEPAPSCAVIGSISTVVASSLTISGTTYPIRPIY
jgi:hypothetical protein